MKPWGPSQVQTDRVPSVESFLSQHTPNPTTNSLLGFSLSTVLHRCLHRPPLHPILAAQCPLRCMVVPRQGTTQKGREEDPCHAEQRGLEVHEGLLPRHGKCHRSHWLLRYSGTNFELAVWRQVWGQRLWHWVLGRQCWRIEAGWSSQLSDYCKTQKKYKPTIFTTTFFNHLNSCMHLILVHSSSSEKSPLACFPMCIL